MEKGLKITKELTPKELNCGTGPCPAIFETNNGTYAIIGKNINAKELGIEHRLNNDEILVEVPKKLIDNKS